MSGVSSPTLLQHFAPKAMQARLFGWAIVPNPKRRWWSPWRPPLVRVEQEWPEPRPVRMTATGVGLESDSSLDWEFDRPFDVDGMLLYADGEPIAWTQFEQRRKVNAGERVHVEKARFILS